MPVITEKACALGGIIVKPYISNGKIYLDTITPDCFFPVDFSENMITSAVFPEQLVIGKNCYTRLEFHRLNPKNNQYTVENKCYRSSSKNSLGSACSFSEVPQWADMKDYTVLENAEKPLFAYFKMPIANTIDTYSPLGVSAYSRATKLIKDADEQYSRILWEFEGSELAIDIDRDALTLERDKDGNDITIHSKLQNRLYRKVDMNEESTYEVFSPPIRDASLFNGLNNILMRIEDVCEMARGTLSDVNAEARTATEIAVLKQRSYAANAQLQKSLEDTLKDVVYIMDVYTTLYELAPDGDYNVSFEWDDSIQVDKESEMNKRLALVHAGISNKVEFRMWYYGETEQQAIQALFKGQQYNNYEMMNSPEMQQNEE